MFEHTVVAAHFGSASALLLDNLDELRERGTRELTLVNVLLSHHTDAASEEHRAEVRRRLEEEADELRRAGFEVHVELRSGQPAHEVATIARARGASLILAGTRGEQYFREFLRGSTVLQLLRRATTPVLLEPIESETRTVTGRGFSDLLLATDFSASARDAETMALQLAEKARRLTVLHVVEEEESERIGQAKAEANARAGLEAIVARAPTAIADRLRTRVVTGTPSREIVQTANEVGATMLVMGKRGRSPVQELLLGSTTQRTVRQASHSLLVVPSTYGRIV